MIVLPQGVAFATLAGMPPEYGLYGAMLPAIVGALWGSSWHLISGPTNATSLMVLRTLLGVTRGLAAGIALGARVPIVLPARGDSIESRMASCVLAALVAARRRSLSTAPAAAAEPQIQPA